MKNIVKKATPALAIVAIAVSMAIPASAAIKGSLPFYHGVKPADKVTYAQTVSTEVENSMGFSGTIVITGGEMARGTYTLSYWDTPNVKSLTYNVGVGKSKGNSSFNYYVDGVHKHTSTAPWDFDFT